MMAYQPRLMSSYSRLSSILELENLSVQQTIRESIHNEETLPLKTRQEKLASLQQNVDDLWKVSRWIFDTLQTCQDKNLSIGIPLGELFGVSTWSEVINNRLSLASQASELSISSVGASGDRNSVMSGCGADSNYGDGDLCCSSSSSSSNSRNNNGGCYSGISLKIYGTDEIGFSSKISVEVLCPDDSSTSLDIVRMASEQFLLLLNDDATPNSDSTAADGGESDSQEDRGKSVLPSLILSELENLVLVVVAGSRERVLKDDLQLSKLQNPWIKGTLYLRLKKEAIRATKWGLSTSV